MSGARVTVGPFAIFLILAFGALFGYAVSTWVVMAGDSAALEAQADMIRQQEMAMLRCGCALREFN